MSRGRTDSALGEQNGRFLRPSPMGAVPARRYTYAPGVYAASLDDGTAVLLDTRRGRWIGVGGSGAELVNALRDGGSIGTVVGDLRRRTNAPPDVVERDMRGLFNLLLDEALVTETAYERPARRPWHHWHLPVRPAVPPWPFDRIVGVGLVALAWVLLRCLRLQRCGRLLGRLRWRNDRAFADDRVLFDRIVAATRTHGVLGTSAFQCLESSLAAAVWCGLAGVPADWCLGVRSPPFAAHAWIEFGGPPADCRSSEFVVVARI